MGAATAVASCFGAGLAGVAVPGALYKAAPASYWASMAVSALSACAFYAAVLAVHAYSRELVLRQRYAALLAAAVGALVGGQVLTTGKGSRRDFPVPGSGYKQGIYQALGCGAFYALAFGFENGATVNMLLVIACCALPALEHALRFIFPSLWKAGAKNSRRMKELSDAKIA